MRTRPIVGFAAVIALSATLAVTAMPAGASTRCDSDRSYRTARHHESWRGRSPATLSIVHGVPDLAVDIYVVKNFRQVKKLTNVTFGTAADLADAFPHFITKGLYFIDVVPTGASPWRPLLSTTVVLGSAQSKSIVAYVTADSAGTPGRPALGVFDNDVSSTGGQSRVTVRHLAVAPTVGVYANGAVAVTPAFSNGETAAAVVPAGTYAVTVTAPNSPSTAFADIGDVTLAADTNTLAFAIGTYGSTFRVASVQVPTT